ncbi:NFACT family protein, partial [Nanoarchaeota archaeon]
MKSEISSLELKYVVEEMQDIIDGKIDKVYQIGKKEFYIQLYVPNKGKKIIKITSNMMYLSSAKQSSERPPGFCEFLRRHLANGRIREIKQEGFQRIVTFTITTRENTLYLIVELLDPGNVLLCEKDEKGELKIRNVAENQIWKDRTLRARSVYKLPEQKYNFLDIKKKDLKEIVNNSDKENLVKTLAIDLSLGGVFSEELCLLSGIDKTRKKLKDDEIEKLFNSIKKLKGKKGKANVVRDKEDVIDIVP